jgi:hypothetical protein
VNVSSTASQEQHSGHQQGPELFYSAIVQEIPRRTE